MKHLKGWTWPNVVANAVGAMRFRFFIVAVNTHEGGVVENNCVTKDGSLGLPTLVDSTNFDVNMTAIKANFTTVFIFEDDNPNDRTQFLSWSTKYITGRFVETNLDSSHSADCFYAAMFRDDEVSQDEAMLFKLTEFPGLEIL